MASGPFFTPQSTMEAAYQAAVRELPAVPKWRFSKTPESRSYSPFFSAPGSSGGSSGGAVSAGGAGVGAPGSPGTAVTAGEAAGFSPAEPPGLAAAPQPISKAAHSSSAAAEANRFDMMKESFLFVPINI